MIVKVYSGSSLVEVRICTSKEEVDNFAAYWSDNGYRVRISD